MSMRRFLITSICLACLAQRAAADTLVICIGDRPYPPLFFPDHDGQAQWLVRKAVERLGGQVQFEAVPWRRCLQGLRTGAYAGGLPVIANMSFLPHFAFPTEQGRVDADRQLARVNHMVVRRIGSNAEWDGRGFSKMSGPVLFPAGIVVIRETLAAMGASGDEGSAHERQTLAKLLARQGDLAIIQSGVAQALIADVQFRDRLEILPQPFVSLPCFLAFNRAYYEANRAYAEAVWREIQRLRVSAEWKALAPSLAK